MNVRMYNNRVFVADLIVTSIWILFAAKYIPLLEYWMLAAMIMRLALCFQLHSRAGWTGYSAIVFACAYFMLNYLPGGLRTVPGNMILYGLHLVDWDLAHDAFLNQDSGGFDMANCVLWCVLSAWLVVLPLAVALCNRLLFRFPKWSWVNIVAFGITAVLGLRCYRFYNLFALWIVISCFLPEICWVVTHGRKESLADVLLRNRELMLYLGFVALFLGAVIIGFRNVYTLKPVGFVLFPLILYVLSAKCAGLQSIPTFDTVMMSVSGGLFWFSIEAAQTDKIILMSVAVVITIPVGLHLMKLSSNRAVGLCLIIGNSLILCPALMGMNPYVVTNASHTRPYMKKAGAYNGLYVTDNFDGKCGLRDRHGEILPMKYFSIDILDYDRNQNLLCCNEVISDNGARPEYDEFYTFFDLESRRFLEIPDSIPVKAIEEIKKGIYALYNESEEPSFYLVMPWCGGEYIGSYTGEYQLVDNRMADAVGAAHVEIPEEALEVSSRDGKIRIYSWNTGLGGTSPDFASYIQVVRGDTTITDFFYPQSSGKYVCGKDLEANGYAVYEGSSVQDLWQMDLPGENPVYIVTAYQKASSVEGNSSVFALQFDTEGKLVKKPFVLPDSEVSDCAEVSYYIPDWYFTTDGLGWDWVVSFDDRTNCLYVAQPQEWMVMTDRYDIYRYDRGKMRFKRNDAGYWLHPSLHEFYNLSGIYRTDTRTYRIDRIGYDNYRLACWGKGKDMSAEPDLIITGGREGVVENAIVFNHDSYEYIVPEYRKGQGNDFGKIIIRKDGGILEETDV